jgi:signal transduction histidine kinase
VTKVILTTRAARRADGGRILVAAMQAATVPSIAPTASMRNKLLGLGGLAWLAGTVSAVMEQDSWTATAAIAGFACLAVWLAAFVWHSLAHGAGSVRGRFALVGVQALAALAAIALLRDAMVPILLVVVAAQLPGYLAMRLAVAWVLAASAVVYLVVSSWAGVAPAVTLTIAYLAFQYFSLLLSATLLQAEQARAELAAINSQLLATQALLHESVRDRERLRIARELHDLIGHKLTALQLNLQVAARTAAGSREVETAREIAGGILNDIRNVVAYVPASSGVPLTAALQELARAFPASLVHVDAAPDAHIEDLELAQHILRCAQEATSNAIRHGRATRIDISLRQESGELVLAVIDNGAGLGGAGPGFGLASIEARVRELGGRFSLGAAGSGGTALRIAIPAQGA